MSTAVAAALVLGSATGASASHSVEIVDTGAVEAKGAAAVVSVEVDCPVGSFVMGTSVVLTQRVGNRIADGSSFGSVTCTGEPQTLDVRIVSSEVPFKPGVALATVNMLVCEPMTFTCHSASDAEEIRLRK